MYPDLSYLFHDLLGTSVDNWTSIFKTFGIFLSLAIFSGACLFYLELKRKAGEGLLKSQKVWQKQRKSSSIFDIVLNGGVGFLLGYKLIYIINHLSLFQANAETVLFSNKGSIIGGVAGVLAMAGPLIWRAWRNRQEEVQTIEVDIYPHDRIGEFTIIAAIFGIIGAKFFAIIEKPAAFAERPLEILFSGSGLAIYGGLIFGFIGSFIYLRRKKIAPLHVLDAVVPALLIGYAIGRLGCHFSGDGDWGIVNTFNLPSWWFLPDWLWAYDYPNNVNNVGVLVEGCDPKQWQNLASNRTLTIYERCMEACGIRHCYKLSSGVFPTSIYESMSMMLLCLGVWSIRKKIQIPGMLFFIYLIINGVERFLIEKIRVNDTYDYLPFQPTQAEIISTLFFLAGAIGCYILWKKHQIPSNK